MIADSAMSVFKDLRKEKKKKPNTFYQNLK